MSAPREDVPTPEIDDPSTSADEQRGDRPALVDPAERSALAFAGFMMIAGVMHFVVPSFYRRIVPKWAGDPKRVVWWSGWAEIACGSLVALPKTRRLGAWAALVLLIAVYPANIKMALDAGPPRDSYSWGAWVRLPMQIPMWLWAARTARNA